MIFSLVEIKIRFFFEIQIKFTIKSSREKANANHCDICRLLRIILTYVISFKYVQVIFTPISFICVDVVAVRSELGVVELMSDSSRFTVCGICN